MQFNRETFCIKKKMKNVNERKYYGKSDVYKFAENVSSLE